MSPGARSEEVIMRATLDLMAEEGFAGLTVDAVAARAGVGKATIYRHWGSRAKLVYAAASCFQAEEPDPNTGTLRGDLTEVLTGMLAFLAESDTGRVLPSLVDAAARDPELAELREEHVRAKRARAVRVLERAVARGELPEGTDLERAIDLFAGPPFYRRLMTNRPMGPDDIEPHVELVLRALGAERSSSSR